MFPIYNVVDHSQVVVTSGDAINRLREATSRLRFSIMFDHVFRDKITWILQYIPHIIHPTLG